MKQFIFLFLVVTLSVNAQDAPVSYNQILLPANYTLPLDVTIVNLTVNNGYYVGQYYDTSNNLLNLNEQIIPGKYLYTITRKKYAFSVMTIPFKARPEIDGVKSFAKADIKSAGVNFAIPWLTWVRKTYLYDGTSSEVKWSFGVFIAPGVEEFNTSNTRGVITTPTSQMVLSSGLSAILTYKGINFAAIPLGTDFGLTGDAKSWVYNRKIWFGIGLGIDGKTLGF